MPTRRRPLVALRLSLLLAGLLVAASVPLCGALRAAGADEPATDRPPPTAPRRPLQVPADLGEAGLPARKAAQLATLPRFDVYTGFGFTDRCAESGITFEHHIVDDAGLHYKPVHYDHGNGIVAADVDGDGRQDLYFLTQLGRNELWRNLGGGRFADVTDAAGVAMPDRVSVSATFADVDNDGDPDLYVTTVRHGNALFVNDGKGHFTEVTEAAGLAYSGHSSAALFFDYDNDGWLDLLLVNVGRYTIDQQGRGGYWIGRNNAFQAHTDPTLSEASVLYRNLGGDGKGLRFADVTEKALLVDRSWSGDAVAADFNGDGWQDLYLLDMQGSDHYYENVRGRFFVDRTATWFPRTPPGSMGVQVFDWNRDGRLDLYITDMHSDMIEEVGPEREKEKTRTRRGDVVLKGLENNILGNAFYQRTASGFEEISDAIGAENYWPWGVSVGDLNADGWDDLFVTASMNFPFRYGVDSVMLNNRGERFLDAEFILGVEPRKGGLSWPWFDLDCPPADPEEAAADAGEAAGASADEAAGRMAAGHHGSDGEAASGADLRWTWEALGAASSGDGPHPLCQGRSGPWTVMAAEGSRSSVIFDLDGDGDLDVVTNEFNSRPRVLVSDLAQRRPVHWLAVDLVGTRSNRDGLGARVTVYAGGLARLELADGKSGYLSQSALPLYFGLGDAATVERVEVEWPSGAHQEITAPPANRLLVVTEPEPPPEPPPAPSS